LIVEPEALRRHVTVKGSINQDLFQISSPELVCQFPSTLLPQRIRKNGAGHMLGDENPTTAKLRERPGDAKALEAGDGLSKPFVVSDLPRQIELRLHCGSKLRYQPAGIVAFPE